MSWAVRLILSRLCGSTFSHVASSLVSLPISLHVRYDGGMPRTCEYCSEPLPTRAGPGRVARFCPGSRCRVAAHRANKLPKAMEGRRWGRAAGKRPLTVDGRSASTTQRSTWSTYQDVRASKVGNGFGVMLGGGLGCYDLDHVTDEQVAEFVAKVPEPVVLVERSMSGDGAHVFVEAPEGPGTKRVVDGVSVERYTRARFIRTTLDRM